ncbi:restriction endonuclease subunit S [Bifidobacterium callimiconis]|uniref:Type I restriction modification DNA specificity domain-containing protein n=1 Tax=Bifidobacterium callimiconis TaxID=2306973 RepID=A0A430FFE9_9BIFI|nr:restriction endonuclease subunit S [Bifidobacterium callimiconis]RSX51540.1 Type I restriction modification DNA specificity domain-containing protein [Bifidobacterium callimiconis]
MERYNAYKDSGVDWIGEIPAGWKTAPLKRALSIFNGADYKPYVDDVESNNTIPVYGSGGCFAYCNTVMHDGESVLLGRKGTVDKPLYVKDPFWTVDTMYYAIAHEEFSTKYLWYLSTRFNYEKYQYGSALPSMTQRDLYSITCAFPTLQEQQAIADYLDEKTSAIDSAVKDIERSIELLNEYRQSVISEAVTKGLDPSVPMKDSGTDWIGQIPAEWEIVPLHARASFSKGLSITKDDLVKDGKPVLSYGQIHSKTHKAAGIEKDLIRFVSDECPALADTAFANEGSLIMADTSEDVAGSGNCAYVDKQPGIYAGYHTIVINPSASIGGKYLGYLAMDANWRSQIRSRVSGVKLYSITQKILKEVNVLVPPESERKAIADYLDEQCDHIDSLIAQKRSLIVRLKEYRASLISECVTGKVKVPGARETETEE